MLPTLTKRTNILFDTESWDLLNKVSQAEQKSIGALVRQAVLGTYLPKNNQQILSLAHQRLRSLRVHSKKAINYRDLIHADHHR